MLKRLLSIIAVLSLTLSAAAQERFIDFGPASKFIETDAHIMGGGSTVMQNYTSAFPAIQNRNVNMGNSWGAGAKAVFGLRNYLGIGTSLNLMLNNYNIDMAILGAEGTSISAVFINNRYYTVNIPVFISFRFNIAHKVRWNIDAGIYFSYGFAGRQNQRIYRAEINEVDELVPEIEKVSTDYYNSPRTLFNRFMRNDFGGHVATSLDFGPHFNVGVQIQPGTKNTARSNGVTRPSVHNLTFHGVVGYRF